MSDWSNPVPPEVVPVIALLCDVPAVNWPGFGDVCESLEELPHAAMNATSAMATVVPLIRLAVMIMQLPRA
jgi:hypothetical protein